MVDVKEIKVGDRVRLNEGTVTQVFTDGELSVRIDGATHANSIYPRAIAEVMPRPFRVGDVVRLARGTRTYQIVSIVDGLAWIQEGPDNNVIPLSGLRHAS